MKSSPPLLTILTWCPFISAFISRNYLSLLREGIIMKEWTYLSRTQKRYLLLRIIDVWDYIFYGFYFNIKSIKNKNFEFHLKYLRVRVCFAHTVWRLNHLYICASIYIVSIRRLCVGRAHSSKLIWPKISPRSAVQVLPCGIAWFSIWT